MDAPDFIISFLILSRPYALIFLSLLIQFRISFPFMTASKGVTVLISSVLVMISKLFSNLFFTELSF